MLIVMRYLFFFSVFLFFGTFSLFSTASAQGATLYFVPASSVVSPGQTFRVQVMVDTKGEFVNAIAAYFLYPADKFDAVAVDRTGSAMTLFAEDKALGGRVDISGGTPTPGFSGIQKIASVDFRVKPAAVGVGTLSFLSDAAILRNSDNQNILSLGSSGKATLQIGPPAGGPTPTPPPVGLPVPVPTPPSAGGPEPSPFSILDIKVEKLNEESVLLSWKTNEETIGSVHYGLSLSEDYSFSLFDSASAKEHSFLLSNVNLSGGYSFEIVGVDQEKRQVKTERLSLEEFLVQKNEQKPFDVVDKEFEIGGFTIHFPLLVVFALLPIFVVVLLVWLLFSRMRARVER